MRVAIIGGKLQGVEATYLAKKAGWQVVLFDRREQAQASCLADTFYCMDILTDFGKFVACLEGVNVILPAIEDQKVLNMLGKVAKGARIPVCFDLAAYSISSSKQISNRFFLNLGIPAPRSWPECQFPVLVKPSNRSGSEGVQVFSDRKELEKILSQVLSEELVIEEYLKGPSYSIEVVGFAGKYQVFQITELEMDRDYDCKRVLAPVKLADSLKNEFEEVALKLASSLSLHGIMDVETILHDGKLKVLEIDARLPSQTPTAVYHSTGINMVECLACSYLQGNLNIPTPRPSGIKEKFVIYEHFSVSSEKIEASGEHILTQAGPLRVYTDFFGADEVLTDYVPGKEEWVLTLITQGMSSQNVWQKRNLVLKRIREELKIPKLVDPYPPMYQPGG